MTCHYSQASAKKFGKFGHKKIQCYRCLQCGKTFSEAQDRLDEIRTDLEKAVQIVNLLAEGVGINAAARIAGVNKRTVLRLLLLAGERCEKLMDSKLRDLQISEIQADEIWTFVRKKQNHLKATDDPAQAGDFYTFIGIDKASKLVISYLVGKGNSPCAIEFMRDWGERVISNDVQISADSFGAYRAAVLGVRARNRLRSDIQDLRSQIRWTLFPTSLYWARSHRDPWYSHQIKNLHISY